MTERPSPRVPASTRTRRTLAAIAAVLDEARAAGTSNRDIEALDRTLRITAGETAVSDLDAELEALTRRPIADRHARIWLDASHHRTWVLGSRVTTTAVFALALDWRGATRLLGLALGARGFILWATLLQSLVERGLEGVRQVIAAPHPGVRSAIAAFLPDARWLPLDPKDDPALAPLLRLRADLIRRTEIIGAFPSRAALRRLLGAMLADAEAEKRCDSSPVRRRCGPARAPER